ncbi:hypothetical protein XENORESO_000499 [Xenotaenia resolanae]|uniref:Uncharacterized protein n=1 Tax=Xenotaenia resolanae TaxID=208358 RepID=A0ABV0VNP5_9TELE
MSGIQQMAVMPHYNGCPTLFEGKKEEGALIHLCGLLFPVCVPGNVYTHLGGLHIILNNLSLNKDPEIIKTHIYLIPLSSDREHETNPVKPVKTTHYEPVK